MQADQRRRMSVADMTGTVRRPSKQLLALDVPETRADQFHSKRYHNQADLVCKTPSFRKQCELNQQQHPSIRDYYRTVCNSPSKTRVSERPRGMNNYSSIQFGDERMHQDFESVSLAMSRVTARARDDREVTLQKARSLNSGARTPVAAPPTGIVRLRRQNEYRRAMESVGPIQVKNLERMMRDKLQQRTSSGPFQLRKNFRYFDVDADGEITLMEFSECLHKMGFEFKEEETIALFGLYDGDGNGSIDYNEFCDKLMEKEFVDVRKNVRESAIGDQLGNMLNKLAMGNGNRNGKRDGNGNRSSVKINKYGKAVTVSSDGMRADRGAGKPSPAKKGWTGMGKATAAVHPGGEDRGESEPALDSSRSNSTTGSSRSGGTGSTDETKDHDDEYSEEEAEVVRIFNLVDRDNSGSIDVAEWELLSRALGKTFTKAESARILGSLDHDNSGAICLNEFMHWWRDQSS